MFIFIQPLEKIMMETRDPLEWHFKQLDHAMGLSFKANFNFALVGYLIKFYHHNFQIFEGPFMCMNIYMYEGMFCEFLISVISGINERHSKL